MWNYCLVVILTNTMSIYDSNKYIQFDNPSQELKGSYMDTSITSAAPRSILLGVDDNSTEQIPLQPIEDGQHLPLFLIRTVKGDHTRTQVVDAVTFNKEYGAESLSIASECHTHQTEGVIEAFSNANASVAIKRIVGESPTQSAVTIGFDPRGKLLVADKDADEFTMELFSFGFGSVGEYGDKYSITIFPIDDITQQTKQHEYNGHVYGLSLHRHNPREPVQIISNAYGSYITYFTLAPTDNYGRENEYYLPNVFKAMYDGTVEKFETPIVHVSQFELLHKLAIAFDMTDKEHYWEYDILDKLNVRLTEKLHFKFSGGSDGFAKIGPNEIIQKINYLKQYDTGVRQYLSAVADGHELGNMAKYPINAIYDTGFSLKTKLALRNILGIRQDIFVHVTPFMVANHVELIDGSEGFNYSYGSTHEQDMSLASYLRTAFSLYPESVAFGTPTMRTIITVQSGIKDNSQYRQRQSIVIDLIGKLSRYCGSGDKRWKSVYAFDQSPANNLTGWRDVNYLYRSRQLKETAWDTGIIWVENRNRRQMFYPAFQTIYPDDTSALNNIFFMLACCTVNKINYRAWALHTGNAKETDEVLFDNIDNYILDEVRGIFDERFIIEPKTSKTPSDEARGFSWTTVIHIYSQVSKTVGSYVIQANRRRSFVDE